MISTDPEHKDETWSYLFSMDWYWVLSNNSDEEHP
ncbi:unnamed protein product, partial [marine sediment metagenome]